MAINQAICLASHIPCKVFRKSAVARIARALFGVFSLFVGSEVERIGWIVNKILRKNIRNYPLWFDGFVDDLPVFN